MKSLVNEDGPVNQEAYAAMSKMINAFPQSAADVKALLLTYDEDLAGISDLAIIETAQRFRRNEVPGQHDKFAPSVAEFVTAARKQADVIAIRSQPRISPPSYRPGRLAPFQIAAERAKAANAHRPVIQENATLEQFQAMSRAGQLPVGASWVACLATIYGPEPKQHSVAAE